MNLVKNNMGSNRLSFVTIFFTFLILTFAIPLHVYASSAVVTGVTSSPSTGTIGAGQTVAISVTFDQVVTVTGTPQLILKTIPNNKRANYVSGSGSDTVVFNYTVTAGDTSSHLDYLDTCALVLSGGSINTADLTLPVPGAAGSLGANSTLTISTISAGGFVQIEAGTHHTIALRDDGSVWTQGSNSNGQLGNGTTIDRSVPIQVSGLNNIVAVAAGYYHSLALKNDGTVWSWGFNSNGQLGDGTTTDRTVPVQVSGLSHVVSISGGGNYSTVLRDDGTVWAWGNNDYGQLGDGTITQRTTPVQVNGLTHVIAISEGGYHSLALKDDGTVWSWGSNTNGQLGDGTTTQRTTPVQVSGLTSVIAVSAGWYHSLALKNDGTVSAWGSNSSGQLGDGTATQRTTPVQVSGLTHVVAIAGGFYHSIALKDDGTVWTWGSNYYGQLGNGTTTSRNTPIQASSLTSVIAVAGGYYHSISLKSDGTVWAWGHNGFGELGDGTTSGRRIPVDINGLSHVTAVAGGYSDSIALKDDGTVWAWGYNGNGQIGDGTTSNKLSPVLVNGLTNVTSIAAGDNHNIALKSDKTVWTWGKNNYGQLGDGTTTDRSTAVQVSGLTHVVAIAGGFYHSIALKDDGTVWTWGRNNYGQLGDGTTTDRNTAVQVSGLNHVIAVSAGTYHSLALKDDGTVWGWGYNSNGQLGDGTTTNRTTPVQVGGLSHVVKVVTERHHSLVLKDDATVWAWGSNSSGQLGDGTTTQRTTPVQVGGLTDIIVIAAGNFHSLAVKGDGTVWAWGQNSYGQLGYGATTSRNVPTQVSGLTNIISVAGGLYHSLAAKNDGSVCSWGYNFWGQLGMGEPYKTTPVQASIDLTPPQDATFNPSITTPTNENITISVDYPSDAVTWQVKIGAGSYTHYTVPITVNNNAVIYAKSQDESGNWSNEASYAVTNIDTTPPSTPVITTASQTVGPLNITIEGTAEAGSTVNIIRSGTSIASGIAAGGVFSISVPLTADAENILTAKSTDPAGNLSGESSAVVITNDSTPPADATFSASSSAPTNGSITISVSYPEDAVVKKIKVGTGSYIDYTEPVILSVNQAVYAKSQDMYGNWSNQTSYEVTNIYPATVGSMTINDGSETTNNTSVTLSISTVDAMGVAEMMISNIPDFAGANWEAYGISKVWTLSTGNGTKTVYIKFKNNLGTISSIYSASIVLNTYSYSRGDANISTGYDQNNAKELAQQMLDKMIRIEINGTQQRAILTEEMVKALFASNKEDKTQQSKILINIPKEDNITAVETTMPASLMDMAKTKGVKTVEVSSGVATIAMQPGIIDLAKASTFTLSVKKVDKEKDLTMEQKQMVGDNPAYDISAELQKSDGTKEKVSTLNEEVQVKIPYDLKPGDDPDKITVFYVDGSGNIENKSGKYDPKTKAVIFTTKHFSKYVIKQNVIKYVDIQGIPEESQIEAMAAKGIVKGVSKNRFEPQASITRAEFIALLVRAFKLDDVDSICKFKDVKKNKWYYKEIASAAKAGIIAGNKDGTFKPDAKISMKDMIQMAVRVAKKQGINKTAAALGVESKDNATRAKAVNVIYLLFM
jgi:alpha-tubulin suppressor-like RCC1 family protein